MGVDKFGCSLTTSQNVTNVGRPSHEYLNYNFLRKGQAINMNGQIISNLGSTKSPEDAVRRVYVNEKFFRREGKLIQGKNRSQTSHVLSMSLMWQQMTMLIQKALLEDI